MKTIIRIIVQIKNWAAYFIKADAFSLFFTFKEPYVSERIKQDPVRRNEP